MLEPELTVTILWVIEFLKDSRKFLILQIIPRVAFMLHYRTLVNLDYFSLKNLNILRVKC